MIKSQGRSLLNYTGGTDFLEGASIFKCNNFFYSRRIGEPPGYFSTPSDVAMLDQPDTTTILGAVKLTGKTATGTSIGVLEAVTASEYATIEEVVTDLITGQDQTERREHLIEPMTNYFVGRVQQDMLKGNSRIGVIGR